MICEPLINPSLIYPYYWRVRAVNRDGCSDWSANDHCFTFYIPRWKIEVIIIGLILALAAIVFYGLFEKL
jgi:hypothetical protein